MINYPANRSAFENGLYQVSTGQVALTTVLSEWNCGESWGYHYSPYAYYFEHCHLLLSENLETNEWTRERLADSLKS